MGETQTNQVKNKTISGLFWSFTDVFVSQGIQFIILMILARILSPEHFGIIGMIAVFIAISNSIIDSGFTQALIRDNHASQEDYSTVFFFNLSMSVAMYIILFYLAVPISEFFKEGQLVPILRVLSLGLIINSLGIIQRVALIKKINFKTQTKINLLAALLAGIVAIFIAFQGGGVWSLVAQTLTLQVTETVLLWSRNRWVPMFTFRLSSFKRLFGFGSKLLISGLIDTIYTNVYSIIIGRLYPIASLGLYTNAVKLRDVITSSTTSALQRVTYPVLSGIQEDEERLKHGFQRIIRTSAYVMFPVMIGLMAISDALIPLLLGPKWIGSIVYFKILCLAGMLYPLHAVNLNMLQVKGRSDLFLVVEIIKKAVITTLIAVSLYFSLGIIGLIGAAVISSYIALFINVFCSAKVISYSLTNQLKDIIPPFIISILMGGIVYLSGLILPENHLIKIGAEIVIGIASYIILSKLARIEEYKMIVELAAQSTKKLQVIHLKRRAQ